MSSYRVNELHLAEFYKKKKKKNLPIQDLNISKKKVDVWIQVISWLSREPDFIHVHSLGAGADNPWGTEF